uniref:Uncharacterized protein n=1 Tax=Anguilla anguilla TaxID=7936 RepID=A0A0E9TYY1_ANGAN
MGLLECSMALPGLIQPQCSITDQGKTRIIIETATKYCSLGLL